MAYNSKNNFQTIGIIQARSGSSRLPNKVLLPLGHTTVIGFLIDKLKKSKTIDKLILATSKNKKDDILSKYCELVHKIEVFRGSEINVLSRYRTILNKYKCKTLVRITGDTPLQFIDLIDKHNKHIINNNINFIFATSSCFISGFDIYNYNFFKKNLSNLKNKIDQEHVGSYFMIKNHQNFDFNYSIIPKKIKDMKARITIDYLSDYFFYLENFSDLNKIYTIKTFIKFYEKNKNLFYLNSKNSESLINSKLKLIKKENKLKEGIKKINFFKF